MILQSDSFLNYNSDIQFKDKGCALFCITEWAVKKGYYVFEREKYLYSCEDWKTRGIIDNECTVLNWNLLCKELNLPYEIVIENGTHKLIRPPLPNEIQIMYLKHLELGYKHFVNGDNRDNVIYDPLGESNTAKAYYEHKGILIGRRIFRRVKL